jgi:hypothetical protein
MIEGKAVYVQAEKGSRGATVLTRMKGPLARTAGREKMLENLQFKR